MEKRMNDIRNMKKYAKKTIKPILIFLILSFILLLLFIVLYHQSDKAKDVFLFLACLFAAASLFCAIFLIVELCSDLRMDDEKIVLPGKKALKYDEIRSVSIRFIHADKTNAFGSALLGILLFFLSCLVQEDCISEGVDTPKKNRYECIFHMKDGNDIKISLRDYGMEQSREIVAALESKIKTKIR